MHFDHYLDKMHVWLNDGKLFGELNFLAWLLSHHISSQLTRRLVNLRTQIFLSKILIFELAAWPFFSHCVIAKNSEHAQNRDHGTKLEYRTSLLYYNNKCNVGLLKYSLLVELKIGNIES